MVLYQAKAQPVGDPADFVEPVFFDGWWVPPMMVSQEAGQIFRDQPTFAGDPDGFTAADFATFGWERPSELPLEREPGPHFTFPSMAYEAEPGDLVEPVFLDGWYRQHDRQMRVAGIPPLHGLAHTIVDEDFAVAFDTFGWERPSTIPGPTDLANRIHEAFAPDYEAIISTPDLVNFIGWHSFPFVPPMPELDHFTISEFFYELEDSLLVFASPVGGPYLQLTVVGSRNKLTPAGSLNELTPVGSRNKADV